MSMFDMYTETLGNQIAVTTADHTKDSAKYTHSLTNQVAC